MIKKMDHVAVIVKDLDAAVKSYSDMFGFKLEEAREGPGGEFKSAIVTNGDVRMEFLQPLKPGSHQNFLDKRGGGLHHVSFVTDDIEQELKDLKAQGKKLVNEELIVMPNAKIAFVHQDAAENVLIELVQRD